MQYTCCGLVLLLSVSILHRQFLFLCWCPKYREGHFEHELTWLSGVFGFVLEIVCKRCGLLQQEKHLLLFGAFLAPYHCLRFLRLRFLRAIQMLFPTKLEPVESFE